jgi:hypothetical protein
MLKKFLLKRLAKSQVKELSDNLKGKTFEAIPLTGENMMAVELIAAVAQLANITPDELAEQMMKKERFQWFMGQMTKKQLDLTMEMLAKAGEKDLAEDIVKLKSQIEVEEKKNADKTKS